MPEGVETTGAGDYFCGCPGGTDRVGSRFCTTPPHTRLIRRRRSSPTVTSARKPYPHITTESIGRVSRMRRIGEQRQHLQPFGVDGDPHVSHTLGTSTNTPNAASISDANPGPGELSDQLTAFDGQRRALRIVFVIRSLIRRRLNHLGQPRRQRLDQHERPRLFGEQRLTMVARIRSRHYSETAAEPEVDRATWSHDVVRPIPMLLTRCGAYHTLPVASVAHASPTRGACTWTHPVTGRVPLRRTGTPPEGSCQSQTGRVVR